MALMLECRLEDNWNQLRMIRLGLNQFRVGGPGLDSSGLTSQGAGANLTASFSRVLLRATSEAFLQDRVGPFLSTINGN